MSTKKFREKEMSAEKKVKRKNVAGERGRAREREGERERERLSSDIGLITASVWSKAAATQQRCLAPKNLLIHNRQRVLALKHHCNSYRQNIAHAL